MDAVPIAGVDGRRVHTYGCVAPGDHARWQLDAEERGNPQEAAVNDAHLDARSSQPALDPGRRVVHDAPLADYRHRLRTSNLGDEIDSLTVREGPQNAGPHVRF